MQLMLLLLTLAVGTAGGLLAKKWGMPAGAMIGAMLSVAVASVCVGQMYYPGNLRPLVQALSGIIIGCRFTRSDVAQLRAVVKSCILLMVLLLSFTVAFALVMTHFTSLDLMTALFSCAPGGVSDMALISVDFGAEPEQVTILQLVRFVFVLSFFPQFLKRRYLNKAPAPPAAPGPEEKPAKPEKAPLTVAQKARRLAGSLALGVAGGYLFRWVGIPAGAIMGAIVVIVAGNLVTDKVYVPGRMRTIVQICAGSYIGSQITRHAVLSIRELLVPMVIVLVGVFTMSFLSAFVIHKLTGLEFVTSLFSCVPGGIAEMGLIAEELGLDTPKIVVMHTCRVIVVICMFPIIVHFLV